MYRLEKNLNPPPQKKKNEMPLHTFDVHNF